MIWADLGFWIATVASIISAAYTALSYHQIQKTPGTSSPIRSRQILMVTGLTIAAWAAVGFDLYQRSHFRAAEDQSLVLDWGAKSPQTYYAHIDATSLIEYKDSHRVMLIVRLVDPSIDAFQDTAIEKSAAYMIEGATMELAIPGKSKLKLSSSNRNEIAFYVALVPKDYSPDQILCLDDVRRFGGRVLKSFSEDIDPVSDDGANANR